MHTLLLTAYLSLAAGDAVTTCQGFNRGFTEANPMYFGTSSCAKVASIKALTAAGTTYLIERKVKTRKGKIVAYAVLGVISAVPVVLNTRTLRNK